MPGRSVKTRFVPAEEDIPLRASTVDPGKLAVALRNPHNRLNNVVLPTFGFPKSNTE
jgi:hypothetical protein